MKHLVDTSFSEICIHEWFSVEEQVGCNPKESEHTHKHEPCNYRGISKPAMFMCLWNRISLQTFGHSGMREVGLSEIKLKMKRDGLYDCHRRVRWQLMRWALIIANTECADELYLYSAEEITFMNVRRPKHSVGFQNWGARSRNARTRSEIPRKKQLLPAKFKNAPRVHPKQIHVNPGANTAL